MHNINYRCLQFHFWHKLQLALNLYFQIYQTSGGVNEAAINEIISCTTNTIWQIIYQRLHYSTSIEFWQIFKFLCKTKKCPEFCLYVVLKCVSLRFEFIIWNRYNNTHG